MQVHAKLADQCCEHEGEIAARVLEKTDATSAAAFLETRKPAQIAQVMRHALPMTAAQWLTHLSPVVAADSLQAMRYEDASRVLRQAAPDVREAILQKADEDNARLFRKTLTYPDGTAGSAMNPSVLALPGDITLNEAMRRARSPDASHFQFPYVVDREQKLIGILTVRGIMRNSSRKTVVEVMQKHVLSVDAHATGREISRLPFALSAQPIPVVDQNGILIGALPPEAATRLASDAAVEAAASVPRHDASSTLGGVFLDNMLQLTTMIMMAGVRPVHKTPDQKDTP